jgi:hypothetical protein
MRAPLSISVATFALLATLPGCNSTSGRLDPPDPALLVVAPTAASIKGGGKVQLNLSARDEAGQPVTPTGVTWTTSNAGVAAVAADGLVTGLGPGASKITAYWNGIHASSAITVTTDGESHGGCGTVEKTPSLSLKAVCVAR